MVAFTSEKTAKLVELHTKKAEAVAKVASERKSEAVSAWTRWLSDTLKEGCLGPVLRRSINSAREPLQSDAVLRAVQRVRRNSHHQFGDVPRHSSTASATATLETVHAQRCDLTAVERTPVAGEVAAKDECCHSDSYTHVPCNAELLDVVETVSMADDASVASTSAHCHAQVPSDAEAPCFTDHFGYVDGVHTVCAGANDSQAEPLDDPIVEYASPTREMLKMDELDHSLEASTSAGDLSLRASSSSSSLFSTPRRPDWEKAHGRSKGEIEAVLGLRRVSGQLRARHGNVDAFEDADTCAKLAAAGA